MSCTRALAFSALALFLAAAAGADAPTVQFHKSRRSATSEASVELRGTPEQIYTLVTNYREWPALLSDVEWVKVKSGGRTDAEVRFASRSMGHEITVKFANEPGRVVRFKLTDGPHGAAAWGEYRLVPVSNTITRVDGTLYMDVTGAAGWFIRDKTIRSMRDGKLRRDLEDLAKRFK